MSKRQGQYLLFTTEGSCYNKWINMAAIVVLTGLPNIIVASRTQLDLEVVH